MKIAVRTHNGLLVAIPVHTHGMKRTDSGIPRPWYLKPGDPGADSLRKHVGETVEIDRTTGAINQHEPEETG